MIATCIFLCDIALDAGQIFLLLRLGRLFSSDTPYWQDEQIDISKSSARTVHLRPPLVSNRPQSATHWTLHYRTANERGEFTGAWSTRRVELNAESVQVMNLKPSSQVQFKWTVSSGEHQFPDSAILRYTMPSEKGMSGMRECKNNNNVIT